MTQQHRWLFHFGTHCHLHPNPCRNGITDAGFAAKRMLVYMVRIVAITECAITVDPGESQCRSARDLLAPRGNRCPTPDSGCDYPNYPSCWWFAITRHATTMSTVQRCSVLIIIGRMPASLYYVRCGLLLQTE